MDWYEADETWEAFYSGLTREEYVNKFVVEGCFHESVPSDIVKAFKSVSYLIASAYNHYPLLDEALNKMLLTLEMTVKLKATHLNISLTKKQKNGKERPKTLDTLSNEVFKVATLSFLKDNLHRARKWRNLRMHPDKHSLVGIVGQVPENAKLFIDVINLLFLPETSLKKIYSKIDIIGKQLEEYKTGLFTLAYEDTKILINGIYTFKYRAYQDIELLLIYINPVSTQVKELYEGKIKTTALIIALKDFQFEERSITGTDTNGMPVQIEYTENIQNINTQESYHKELNSVSQRDKDSYIFMTSNRALFKMEKIIYEEMWYPVRKAL